MSKKDRIHSLSDMSSAANRRICCSMCKSLERSILFWCKSGRHVICENCQRTGTQKTRNDDGDYIPEKECVYTDKKESSYVNNSELKLKDLASGDHIDTVRSIHNTRRKIEMKKSKTNMLTTSTPKDLNSKTNSDTKIVYKNARFNYSNSSVTSTLVGSNNEVCKEEICERVPRPVACPVTQCARMVTIDSISQHFNFDHSKVPRMILNRSGPQEIHLNYTTLSPQTICIASFVISHKRLSHTSVKTDFPTNSHNSDKGCKLLLLMAAKMPTTPLKLTDIKCISRVITRNSYTQTEQTQKQKEQYNKLSASKSSSENTIWMNKSNNDDDDDEVILLWLCKLDDKNKTYTIMVSGGDKKQAYSYIGDAVHIRGEHDPFSVYSKTQCLSVRKSAINKLLTNSNELKVIISTVL